jgi:hypothetical protein
VDRHFRRPCQVEVTGPFLAVILLSTRNGCGGLFGFDQESDGRVVGFLRLAVAQLGEQVGQVSHRYAIRCLLFPRLAAQGKKFRQPGVETIYQSIPRVSANRG